MTVHDLDNGKRLIVTNAESLKRSAMLRGDVYVVLDGCDELPFDLSPDKLLVENYTVPMESHFLWRGLYTSEERTEYLIEKSKVFLKTGNQLYIEEYKYVETEPFYDYSK